MLSAPFNLSSDGLFEFSDWNTGNEIGYADKSNINTSSVPAQNKITDDDGDAARYAGKDAAALGGSAGIKVKIKTDRHPEDPQNA